MDYMDARYGYGYNSHTSRARPYTGYVYVDDMNEKTIWMSVRPQKTADFLSQLINFQNPIYHQLWNTVSRCGVIVMGSLV